jgi:hypothetical protein
MAARKNNSRVINPHDKPNRAVYGDRDNTHRFLTNNLPGEVVIWYLASVLDEDELSLQQIKEMALKSRDTLFWTIWKCSFLHTRLLFYQNRGDLR